MTGKVRFGVTEEFPYSHCRACDMKILWFNVALTKEEWEDEDAYKPKVMFNQVGDKSDPCYCPYCGEKTLYDAKEEE